MTDQLDVAMGPLGGLPNDRWACERRSLIRDGRTLSYIDATRTVGGPTVVMLHGMLSSADAWRSVIRQLSAPGRVLAPDFRGHGHSDWTRGGYWLSDYADDVMFMLEELDVMDHYLVGHSLGARVAMVMVPRLGERLVGLVLSDTGPEVSRRAAEQAKGRGSDTTAKAGHSSGAKLREHLRLQHAHWPEESIELRARSLFRENWAGKLVHRGDPEVLWLLGRAGLEEVEQMWEGLSAVRCPSLILRGADSFLLNDDITQRMLDHMPSNTQVVELPLGHDMLYENPNAVADALDAFVRTRKKGDSQ